MFNWINLVCLIIFSSYSFSMVQVQSLTSEKEWSGVLSLTSH